MIPRLYNAKETNFEHNGLGILTDTQNCIVTEEQNGMYELELTYKVGSFLSSFLVRDNIIKAKANDEHDPQLFRIYHITENLDGTIEVKAEHISYDLRSNFLEGITLGNVTCQQAGIEAFKRLEEEHNFTFTSDIEHTATYNISRCNGLECVAGKRGSLLDTYGNGAKLIRDNFKMSLVKERGRNNNVLISYKKNLTGFKRELDLTDIVTKIYPYAIIQREATDGSTEAIEELLVLPEKFINSPNINNYNNAKILALDYSSEEGVDSIEKLRAVASKWFSDTKRDEPNINYDVEFVNLYKTSNYKDLGLDQLEKVCLDDIVIVRDFRFGLDVTARVIKTVYNTLAERYEKIELGNFKNSLNITDKDLNEKVDATINKLKNTIVRFDVLDDKVISEVSRLDGDIKTNSSTIKQTSDRITSEVSTLNEGIKSNTSLIEQTANNITFRVDNLNGKYTELKQTVDGINITGMVTFTDLAIDGGTIIHGGNIRANTLSVDSLSSNNNNPIIRLFDNCALDATRSYNQGKGDAIRLKWNNSSYVLVNSSTVDFFLGGSVVGAVKESGAYFPNMYSYVIDNPVSTVMDNSLNSVIDDVIIENHNDLSRIDSKSRLMLNISKLKENSSSHLFIDTDINGKPVVNESSLLALALQEIKNLKQEIKDIKNLLE